MFVVFGLNPFLKFLPMGELPPGNAGQFLGVLMASHYTQVVGFFQLICGLLLLVNRYVPLALAILGPIIVNILTFHILMAPSGLLPGVLATVLWIVLARRVWPAFAGLFQQRTDT